MEDGGNAGSPPYLELQLRPPHAVGLIGGAVHDPGLGRRCVKWREERQRGFPHQLVVDVKIRHMVDQVRLQHLGLRGGK